MACSLPVAWSLADTLRMPLASMSKVTSICGTPRGAGGMPSRWNLPSVRLSRAMGRSPWSTWTSTDVWLSAAVENTRLLRRDGRVALDQPRHHAAQRLDAQRQRRHVEQQHVLDLAGEDRGLDGRADGDDLVRVDALVGLLAEELLAPAPGPWACGSCRRPGRPRRSASWSTPASFSACRHGLGRALDQIDRPAARTWRA